MKTILLSLVLFVQAALYAQTPDVHFGLNLISMTPTEKVYSFYAKDLPDFLACQYSLSFDESKMKYHGVRNSIVEGLGDSNFANPLPGVITSSWFDLDFNTASFIDSTILFEMVFDIVQPGGSSLCFSNEPLEYEFIEGNTDEIIGLVQIHLRDDCVNGLILIEDASALETPATQLIAPFEPVSLSTGGELRFSTLRELRGEFMLHDITGKLESSSGMQFWNRGQQVMGLRHALQPGMYILTCHEDHGAVTSKKIVVQ